jgi:hypothetical protein
LRGLGDPQRFISKMFIKIAVAKYICVILKTKVILPVMLGRAVSIYQLQEVLNIDKAQKHASDRLLGLQGQ